MKAEAGAAFTITQHCALRHMASWWQNGAVFPPPHKPVNWSYAPLRFRPTSNPAARRVRAERHNPHSITTLRLRIARSLLGQLSRCPFCCALGVCNTVVLATANFGDFCGQWPNPAILLIPLPESNLFMGRMNAVRDPAHVQD